MDDGDDDGDNNNRKFHWLRLKEQISSRERWPHSVQHFPFPIFCFKTQMLKYDVEDCNLTAVLWSLVSTETKSMDWGIWEQGVENNNENKKKEDSEKEINLNTEKITVASLVDQLFPQMLMGWSNQGGSHGTWL